MFETPTFVFLHSLACVLLPFNLRAIFCTSRSHHCLNTIVCINLKEARSGTWCPSAQVGFVFNTSVDVLSRLKPVPCTLRQVTARQETLNLNPESTSGDKCRHISFCICEAFITISACSTNHCYH